MDIALLIILIINLITTLSAGLLLVRVRDALVEDSHPSIPNVDDTVMRFLRDNPDARVGAVREFVRECVKAEPEQVAEILIPYYRARVNS